MTTVLKTWRQRNMNGKKGSRPSKARTYRLHLWLSRFPIALAIVVVAGIGGNFVYERHNYYQSLLTPDEIVEGSVTNLDDSPLWSSLRSQLAYFQTDPKIGIQASTVYAKIPEYSEKVASAFQQAAGLEIDYIADAHPEAAVPEGDPKILRSQKKTGELLENLRDVHQSENLPFSRYPSLSYFRRR